MMAQWKVTAVLFALLMLGSVTGLQYLAMKNTRLSGELNLVTSQRDGAQEAYRRAIAEKQLLTNELYLARELTQERDEALKVAQERALKRKTTVIEVIDETGCFDAELPAAVLGMYPYTRGPH